MADRVAIYPGSFDPITFGHLNLIERSLKAVDHLVVAVVGNPSKTPLFTQKERIEMLQELVGGDDRIEIDAFDGLLVDYVRNKGATLVLRGLRAVSDFEYEFEMALMNRKLAPELEFLFMMTDQEYFYVSSSLVREVATLGGDVTALVPPVVHGRIEERLGKKK